MTTHTDFIYDVKLWEMKNSWNRS